LAKPEGAEFAWDDYHALGRNLLRVAAKVQRDAVRACRDAETV
jgi:hypothetical protein